MTCDDFDVHKDEIGYDLRREENITEEYRRRFSPNMFAKVANIISPPSYFLQLQFILDVLSYRRPEKLS